MRRAWGAVWRTGLLPVVAGVAGVLGVLWLVLVAAPPWFVHDRSLEGLKAQNEVRTTLLQGLGGVVLLVGAYFTYRQVLNSREQLAHSRKQLQIAQQGQITERFTRAIDQLGHAQVDVRLGGIYALERIAHDSAADRATIGEVLTAFVRSHAPWPPRLPDQPAATVPIDEVPELQVRAPDVQASLTVLGRGGFARQGSRGDQLDLHAVDLRRANLRGVHLEEADLGGAHLERADLGYTFGTDLEVAGVGGVRPEAAIGVRFEPGRLNIIVVHLEGADLHDAHLEEANLSGAHLENTFLGGAHLERANLSGAHLEWASLRNADLKGADLVDAQLKRVDLSGAHLERANLYVADLKEARADERTAWPEGFDWRAAGVTVAGGDTETNGP